MRWAWIVEPTVLGGVPDRVLLAGSGRFPCEIEAGGVSEILADSRFPGHSQFCQKFKVDLQPAKFLVDVKSPPRHTTTDCSARINNKIALKTDV